MTESNLFLFLSDFQFKRKEFVLHVSICFSVFLCVLCSKVNVTAAGLYVPKAKVASSTVDLV